MYEVLKIRKTPLIYYTVLYGSISFGYDKLKSELKISNIND